MNVGTTLKAKHLRKPIWDGLIKPFISNLNKANTLPVRLSVDNVFDLTVDGSPAMLATSIADYCNGEEVVRIALRIAPSGSGSKPTSKELKVSGLVGEEMASPVPSEASDVGSEPSTPMRFTMQRQASSGGSTPKTTSEFIIQIGERAVSATLTKKLLKKAPLPPPPFPPPLTSHGLRRTSAPTLRQMPQRTAASACSRTAAATSAPPPIPTPTAIPALAGPARA